MTWYKEARHFPPVMQWIGQLGSKNALITPENLKIKKKNISENAENPGTPEVFGGDGGSNTRHQLNICKSHAGVTFDQIFNED